jgi:membrane protein insertase Oxa1/YidC/SpoIIIJ
MFNTILIEPLYNLFFFLSSYFKDPGIAVIVFSMAVRIPLAPIYFFIHKEEDKLKKIQTKIKERTASLSKTSSGKKNKKSDFLRQAEIASTIYQEEKFNPLSNFLIQISPLPILLVILAVFDKVKTTKLDLIFAGVINLKTPNLTIAILTILLQFISLKNQPAEVRKASIFLMGFVAIVLLTVASIFTIYWIVILLWTFLEKKIFHWYEIHFSVNPIGKDNS